MLGMMHAARLWLFGLQEGYPLCCIAAFVKDMNQGRLPAEERQAYDGYVPCSACGKRIGGDRG